MCVVIASGGPAAASTLSRPWNMSANPAADLDLLSAAATLAALPATDVEGDTPAAVAAAAAFAAALAAGADPDVRGPSGLRAVDLLVRGRDNIAAAQAIDTLVAAGADVLRNPMPAEAPPLHAACYLGAWRAAVILVGVGVDPNTVANAPQQKLAGATPLIALVSGYRTAKSADYGECLAVLLEAGADIELRDRRRQSAADLALRHSAATGDRALTVAILDLGVAIHGAGAGVSASAMIDAIGRRSEEHERLGLRALAMKSGLKAQLRSALKPG